MTVDDLRNLLKVKTDAELGEKLNYSKGAISIWRSNGIPDDTQAVLQVRTNGILKADNVQPIEGISA